MIGCSRGDIVLVRFVFPDESGAKVRPALVVSSDPYHASRQEVIVAAITSNVQRRLLGDCLITDWRAAGLLFPSTVTGILRTLKQRAITRRLGALGERDLGTVDVQLREAMAL
jgi:mRNA interferase MazF